MAKTSTLTIDSTKVDAESMAEIEAILYGTAGENPRLPLPGEIAVIVNKIGLLVDPADPGTFIIQRDTLEEDPEDPGTFLIVKDGLYEDPSDPGTYLTGVPE